MAVRFDAASDRCTWTGTAPTPSSGLTITYWAYVVVDRNDFSTMIRLHTSSGGSTVINVATDSGGQLPCIFTSGGSSSGPQNLPVGDWARVAVTVTGSTSRVYVALGAAGATQHQDGTVGASAGNSPTSGYTVGGRSIADGSEWYNGRLAHVRVWSAVLTQTEIESEWASATPVRTSNLFADYPLSGASDLTDHSGNSRHLAAGSTSVTTEDGPPITTTVTAAVAATLPALTTSAAGGAVTAGPLAVDLPALTTSTAGSVEFGGQLGTVLPALDAGLIGSVEFAGQLGTVLPALDTSLAGAVEFAGQLGAVLPTVGASLAGSVGFAGQLGAALPALDTELAGGVTATGTVAVTLPALTMTAGPPKWPPAVTDTPATALVGVSGPHDVPWIAVS